MSPSWSTYISVANADDGIAQIVALLEPQPIALVLLEATGRYERRVASELLRVCRPGGRIAMANWTPSGHVGPSCVSRPVGIPKLVPRRIVSASAPRTTSGA